MANLVLDHFTLLPENGESLVKLIIDIMNNKGVGGPIEYLYFIVD